MWENTNPTFLLKFGKSYTSRYTVGVKNCKWLSLQRKEGSPSPEGGRWMMKGNVLAKNCWIGFLQLYSVQKQIVASNLGLPATQTHKRIRGSIPWTHTIKCSQQWCSYSVWKVQRKTGTVPLYLCSLTEVPTMCQVLPLDLR